MKFRINRESLCLFEIAKISLGKIRIDQILFHDFEQKLIKSKIFMNPKSYRIKMKSFQIFDCIKFHC